jgi:hypothetical protein
MHAEFWEVQSEEYIRIHFQTMFFMSDVCVIAKSMIIVESSISGYQINTYTIKIGSESC